MAEASKQSTSPVSTGRREAVKKIVGGVSVLAAYNLLPVRWEKPIIEQVFLPAHAQTSGAYTLHDPCTLTLISGNQHMPDAKVQVDGYVTPATAQLAVTITATPEGGTGGAVTLKTTTDAEGKFTGTLTVTGGPGMTRINVQTQVAGAANEAACALDLGKKTAAAGTTYFIDSDIDPIHWMAVRVNPDGSATITRVDQNRSRRWEASLSSTPGQGEFLLVASAAGCSPPSPFIAIPPVTVEILAINATELVLLYYGVVQVTIPAAPIPPTPSLTGSCGPVIGPAS